MLTTVMTQIKMMVLKDAVITNHQLDVVVPAWRAGVKAAMLLLAEICCR